MFGGKNVRVKDPCAYSVYAYVFDDGHTYVGLTTDPVKRAKNHRNPRSNSAVQRHWSTSEQKTFPDMLTLYSGLSSSEAQRTEGLLVSNVTPDMRLNIAPTGPGVGGLGGCLERSEEEIRIAKELQRKKAIARARKWAQSHPGARRQYMKEYRQKHLDHLRAQDRIYHVRLRKERLAKMAEYTKAHKEEKRKYDKIYRQLNSEKRKEQIKAWRQRKRESKTMKK